MKNYIIELFINFKIHFILKHVLLYPNEGYIYDILIHPKGQINRGCSYCIRTFQLCQIYSGEKNGGRGVSLLYDTFCTYSHLSLIDVKIPFL